MGLYRCFWCPDLHAVQVPPLPLTYIIGERRGNRAKPGRGPGGRGMIKRQHLNAKGNSDLSGHRLSAQIFGKSFATALRARGTIPAKAWSPVLLVQSGRRVGPMHILNGIPGRCIRPIRPFLPIR
jgi:hypothetical protein